MSNMYTQRARECINRAGKLAQEYHYKEINTLHFLWAIASIEGSVGESVLAKLGLSATDIAADLGDQHSGYDTPEVSVECKQALQEAKGIAMQLHVNYVGTEHLLIGTVQVEGAARTWLEDHGFTPQDVISEVMASLGYKMVDQSGQAVQNKNKNGQKKTLEEFGRDLTEIAKKDGLDPVVGRDKEIQRVIQILSRRTKNNPVLIGEPGVGKTAIVEGLAQKIVAGDVPDTLLKKRVIALDLSSMLAGAKYRGDFEERLQKVMDETAQSKDIILFIDELHTLIGAGAAEGAMDAANILKPKLARGELQCVGATTIDEYRKHIEKDAALERRFQPVMVNEPSEEEAIQILHGLKDKYEAHHGVKITDEAINAAVKLSVRYLPDRYLPDKAIDLIDEAAAKVQLAGKTAPNDLRNLENKLANAKKEKEAAVAQQNFEEAAKWRDEEQKVTEELNAERENWKKNNSAKKTEVDEEEICQVLANWSGVPVAKMQQAEMDKLLHLEDILHERVIGQDEAVVQVARAVRRGRAGLKDPKRPIGSFIFLGPTGVGKTELAKALAVALFDTEDAMIRLDMSEYMEKHAVSRLIGAPPGYVGYDEGGQLTEAVRRRPYSVLLLDEIEKAHPDAFNILLQLLEDGRLTDGKGRTVDFRNTVVIMTSNLGASTIKNQAVMGFGTARADEGKNISDYEKMKERVMETVKKSFCPEFINRIDDILVFHSLKDDDIKAIAKLMVKELANRMKDQELNLEITDGVLEILGKAGFDVDYGARPLRRTILRLMEDPLSEGILAQKFKAGDTVYAYADGDEIKFDTVKHDDIKAEQTESTADTAEKADEEQAEQKQENKDENDQSENGNDESSQN